MGVLLAKANHHLLSSALILVCKTHTVTVEFYRLTQLLTFHVNAPSLVSSDYESGVK